MLDNPTREQSENEKPEVKYHDLIARLEKASFTDRQLDYLIWRAVGNGAGMNIEKAFETYLRVVSFGDIPRYTTSIETAMTLVPQYLMVAIAGPWTYAATHERAGQKIWEVALHETFDDIQINDLCNWDDVASGKGVTAAIALCIAALKAQGAPHVQA